MSARVEVRVTGRVQGVGFRAHARAAARDLGLAGWVRNRHDGSVEGVAEGPREALDRWVEALRRGPSMSRVERVDTTFGEARGESDRFVVRF